MPPRAPPLDTPLIPRVPPVVFIFFVPPVVGTHAISSITYIRVNKTEGSLQVKGVKKNGMECNI